MRYMRSGRFSLMCYGTDRRWVLVRVRESVSFYAPACRLPTNSRRESYKHMQVLYLFSVYYILVMTPRQSISPYRL